VAGAYIGFDQPRTLGSGETGGRAAAPIVRDFFIAALADVADVPFRVPPGARLVPINPRTGERMSFGAPGSILEPFRPGTEPGRAVYSSSTSSFRVPGAADFNEGTAAMIPPPPTSTSAQTPDTQAPPTRLDGIY